MLGAYERGERALSVPRLVRLAELYDVPTDQLLPRETDVEIDLTERGGFEDGFTIDLVRLHELDSPDAEVLARYAATIQLQRQDFNGRMLTIRRDDVRVPSRRCSVAVPTSSGRGSRSSGCALASDASSGGGAGQRVLARPDVATPSPAQLKVLVPGNHLMVGLLGQRDELLRMIESAFPVSIHVRGNEITVTGDPVDAERVGRLFEELVLLVERGHALDREGVGRSIEMMKLDQLPSGGAGHRGAARAQAGPAQDRGPEALRRRDSRLNTITFGIGPAGTGKSYLAVALAVQALQAHQVSKIILTRPAVEAGERLGFLPGDLMAKVDPYLRPLYDALHDLLEPEGSQRLLDRGTIEVAPLAFMRGRTLNSSFIILDEAQNTLTEQMKMFLTRIGFGSKAVITGDVTQIDIPGGRSGLVGLEPVLSGVKDLAFVHLTQRDVVRHRVVADIVAAYERRSGSPAPEASPTAGALHER